MTGPANDWFADEAFWEAMYPFVFSEAARTAASTDVRSFRFRHWLYSAVELRELLKAVGFVKIDVFGNLEGSSSLLALFLPAVRWTN